MRSVSLMLKTGLLFMSLPFANEVASAAHQKTAPPPVTESGEPAGRMPDPGSCIMTRVYQVTTRLIHITNSGTTIIYQDGHAQVSYDHVRNAERARRGDPVRLCVVSVPKDCPPHDFRGVMYRATDLRRHLKWSMRNAEHGCGGG